MCHFLQAPLTVSLLLQVNARQAVEDSLRELEKEKALLKHQRSASVRKAGQETDRKRLLENEGENIRNTLDWPSTMTLN